jgi:hypothetical protein
VRIDGGRRLGAGWRGLLVLGALVPMMAIWSGIAVAQETTPLQVPGDGGAQPSPDDCTTSTDATTPDSTQEARVGSCSEEPKHPSDDSGGSNEHPGDSTSGSGSTSGDGRDGGGTDRRDGSGGSVSPSGGGEHATAPPSDSGSSGDGGGTGGTDDGTVSEETAVPAIILGKSGSGAATARSGSKSGLATKLGLSAKDEDLGAIVAAGKSVGSATPPEVEESGSDLAAAPVARDLTVADSGPLALTGTAIVAPLMLGAILVVGGWLLVAAVSRREYLRSQRDPNRYYSFPRAEEQTLNALRRIAAQADDSPYQDFLPRPRTP